LLSVGIRAGKAVGIEVSELFQWLMLQRIGAEGASADRYMGLPTSSDVMLGDAQRDRWIESV